MSNWLTRLRPQAPKPSETQQIEVKHGFVTRAADTVRDDVFVNPDKESPVAAITVCRVSSEHLNMLSICAIPAKDRKADLVQRLSELKVGGRYHEGFENVFDILKEFDVQYEGRYALPLLQHQGSFEQYGKAFTDEAMRILDILRESNLLSADPALREAVVKKMGSVLYSFKGNGQLPDAFARAIETR